MMNKHLKYALLLIALGLVIVLFFIVSKHSVIDNSGNNDQPESDSIALVTLKQTIKTDPFSIPDWNALAREYLLQQNFEKAYQAFNESRQLDYSALVSNLPMQTDRLKTDEQKAERLKWLTGLAEARILAQQGMIDDDSEGFLFLAMQLDAQHPKALWYAGLNAVQKNEYTQAQVYWQRLEQQSPPGALGDVLRQRLDALNDFFEQQKKQQDNKQHTQSNGSGAPQAIDTQLADNQLADNQLLNQAATPVSATATTTATSTASSEWIIKLKIILTQELLAMNQQETRVFLSLRQDVNLPPLAAKMLRINELDQVLRFTHNDVIAGMSGTGSIDWDKPLRLDIIWAPAGKPSEKNNIRFASLINRDNLTGVNEYTLDIQRAQP